MACPVNAAPNIFRAGGHNEDMGKKRKNKGGAQALHVDMVSANEYTGFVQHIKLPHYVDFQAELSLIRELRKNRSRKSEDEAQTSGEQA